MTASTRYEALLAFLHSSNIPVSDCDPCDCGCECAHALVPLNGDASFRRYYRLKLDADKFKALCESQKVKPALANYAGSVLVMDAPPETQKNQEFVEINDLLRNAKVLVPTIIVKDVAQGFMMLEDLGNTLFIDMAIDDERLAFYFKAMVELMKISCLPTSQAQAQALTAARAAAHAAHSNDEFIIPNYTPESAEARFTALSHLKPFDRDFIHMELGIFTEWLLDKRLHLQLTDKEQTMLQRTFDFLTQECLKQPQVPMHRDYHCRNLMVTPDGCDSSILARLAVIDYQDMVMGPLGYDVASLVFDCYTRLEDDYRERLEQFGYQVVSASGLFKGSFAEYQRMVLICALQRHIKVLGIFNRLNLRDGKPGYLKDLPLVLQYVLENCDAFPEMQEFKAFLLKHVAGKL